jgi:hypothetical protein
MYRITPTTAAATTARSFDLLIRDFASINLRQHRARTFLLHHSSRRDFHTGSTESLRFHVEANELGDKRWRDEGYGLKITGYKDEDSVKVGDAIPLELDEGDGKWREDGWAAEVDVVAPEGHVAAMPGESIVTEAGSSNAMSTPTAEEATVDAAATIGAAATGAALAGHSAAGGSKSRAESRLARRQRRELAGSYKPDAAAREQQTEEKADDESRDNVLSMIEKMDGPALPKPKDKAAISARSKEKRAAKREEKIAEKMAEKGSVSNGIARLLKFKDSKGTSDYNSKARMPPEDRPKRENWQIQKSANLNKFGDSTWQPRKRLSPDTLEGIRALHTSDPATYSTETLSSQFQVSPENIRRILKSKWRPNDDERDEREKRWERRGVRKWTEMAELGERPPRRWREMGVGSVVGEPERRPGWKRDRGNTNSSQQEADGIGWMSDEFGERIL